MSEQPIKSEEEANEVFVFYKNAWAITHETDNGIWHQEFCNGARGAELTVIGNIHDK